MDHIKPKRATELLEFDYTCTCGKTFHTGITSEEISIGGQLMDHIRLTNRLKLFEFQYECLCGEEFKASFTDRDVTIYNTSITCPSCGKERDLDHEEVMYILKSSRKQGRKDSNKEPEEAFRFNNTAVLGNNVFEYADIEDLQIKGVKDNLRINLFADIAETLEGLDRGYPESKKHKKEMYFIKVQLEELYKERVQSHRNGAEFRISAKLEVYDVT